jgi:hypothetical protein
MSQTRGRRVGGNKRIVRLSFLAPPRWAWPISRLGVSRRGNLLSRRPEKADSPLRLAFIAFDARFPAE